MGRVARFPALPWGNAPAQIVPTIPGGIIDIRGGLKGAKGGKKRQGASGELRIIFANGGIL